MKWHKANETTHLFSPKYTHRSVLYELPVLREDLSEYLLHPVSGKLGVSLVLTDMTSHRDIPFEVPELFAKKLMWFVKHLCERTDMRERGVMLRVGITNDLSEMVAPYIEACNFPIDAIDWFDNKESTYHYGSKFEAMRQARFKQCNRVIHFDLSFLIGNHPAQIQSRLFETIEKQWKDKLMVSSASMLHRRDNNPYACNRFALCTSTLQTAHPIWEILSSLYGIDPEHEQAYWNAADPFIQVRGGVFGFSTQFLWYERAIDHIFQMLTADGMCDEAAMSLYARYNQWNEVDVVNLGGALGWETSALYGDTDREFPFCAVNKDTSHEVFNRMHQQ